MNVPVEITINGKAYSGEVEPRQLLVHFIRENAGLTGTKVGCDTSQCGSCTVQLGRRNRQGLHGAHRSGVGQLHKDNRRAFRRSLSCTRFRKRSGTSTACNAGSARLE